MSDTIIRSLPWNAPTTWIALGAVAAFFLLGARAVLMPGPASAFFGVGIETGSGLAFVQAFGARNMGLALTGLALIWLDHRTALAALLLAGAFIAAIDAYAVMSAAGFAKGAKHLGYVVGLGAFGLWLWLRR